VKIDHETDQVPLRFDGNFVWIRRMVATV